MAEDIYELAEVKDPDLLQMLPLLVGGGRTERGEDKRREKEHEDEAMSRSRVELVGGKTIDQSNGKHDRQRDMRSAGKGQSLIER